MIQFQIDYHVQKLGEKYFNSNILFFAKYRALHVLWLFNLIFTKE